METVPFPWKNELKDKENIIQATTKPKHNWKVILGPSLFILALFLLALYNRPNNQARADFASTNSDIVVLLLMTPLAAGEFIEPDILREVLVSKKDLTKNQILERLKKEDLTNLRGKLIAKKDLASGRPIFWKDVTLKRLVKPSSGQSPKFEIQSPQQGN